MTMTDLPPNASTVTTTRPPLPRFHEWDVVRFMADKRFRADPYPRFERLRDHARVHHAVLPVTLISGYEEGMTLLKHPAASSVEANGDLSIRGGRRGSGLVREIPGRALMRLADRIAPGDAAGQFRAMSKRFLILMDPPDHTRIRSLAARAFTPKVVEAIRPRIETIAHELLDGLAAAGGTELLGTYAYELPVIVICELLGVPVADRDRFRAWVPALVAGVDVEAVRSKKARQRADAAATALDAYLRDLIAVRRADPADDLLTALVQAADGEDRLTEDELVAFAALLLVAGHETTANLIGNGLLQLWAHPDQFHRWKAEPELRRSGVEELLRFDSPIQLVQRIAKDDIEIAGVTIPKGRFVLLLLGAANHDPAHFTDPDRLDLSRAEGPPMSFGFGAHHCIGASLARAEAEVALGALVDRFPALRVDLPQPEWRGTLVFRGVEALPVRW